MKKILSQWLMDVAKYIFTALVLSTALGGMLSGWVYYTVCMGLIIIIIITGVVLYELAEKEKREKENNNV